MVGGSKGPLSLQRSLLKELGLTTSTPGALVAPLVGGSAVQGTFERGLAQNDLQASRSLGRAWRPSSHKHHECGLQAQLPNRTQPILPPSPSCQDFKGKPANPQTIHSRVPVKGYYQRDYNPPTPILFERVPYAEERQHLQTHHKPFHPEHHAYPSIIQDGDRRQDCDVLNGSSMGYHYGPERRLLSRPDCLGVPQVLRIQDGRSHLRFPIPSIWSFSSPMGLFKDNKTNKEPPSRVIHNGIFPSGRLPYTRSLAGPARGDRSKSNKLFPDSRAQHKFQKIHAQTLTGSRIPRSTLSFRLAKPISTSGKNLINFYKSQGSCLKSIQYPSRIRVPDRTDRLCLKLRASRKALPPSPNHMVEHPYLNELQRSSNKVGQFILCIPPNLAGHHLPEEAGSNVSPYPLPSAHDRRQQDRMGCGTPPSLSSRSLASELPIYVNQLARTQGNRFSPRVLPSCHQETPSSNSYRQYNSSVMYQETRILEIRTSNEPFQENPRILSAPQNPPSPQTPPRSPECPSRPEISVGAYLHRMVFGSGDVQSALEKVWSLWRRPLRQQGKQSSGLFHITIPRSLSLRGKRPLPALGRVGLPVPLSTHSSNGRSSGSSTEVQRKRFTHSSLLCSIRVVPSPISQVSEPLPSTSRAFLIADDDQGQSIPPRPFSFETSRVGTLRGALTRGGISEEVTDTIIQAHKPSTLKQYQSVWAKFISFLAIKCCPIYEVTIGIVCDFLYLHLHQKKRKYRTIATYKCALRLPIFYAANVDIACLTVELFMRGAYNHNPPNKAKEMPVWSLNGLLSFLDTDRFEPLETAPYIYLLQKSLCLILLSSGRRIGEITNLANVSYKGNKNNRLYLKWLVDFSPKHDTPSFRPSCPSISRLDSISGTQLSLCPIRAYNIFLQRSESWRQNSADGQGQDPFWVKPNFSSPSTILDLSSSFISLIKAYRLHNHLPIDIPIGPHQMRKFSAAYSVQLGQSKATIIKVMGFSSDTILKKNYVAKVPPLTVPCSLPGGSHFPRPDHLLSDSD